MKVLKQIQIDIASDMLKAGKLVAFPTETVFGLGVIYDNFDAYQALIAVKRRPPEKPFTLMCADVSDIEKHAYIDKYSKAIIETFMPGQLTIILKARDSLPSWAKSNDNNVGVRIPGISLIRDLINKVGKPLLVPSANKSGEKPGLCVDDVVISFDGEIDAVIEGESTSKIPSTIADMTNGVHIIREGIITKEMIDKCLKEIK